MILRFTFLMLCFASSVLGLASVTKEARGLAALKSSLSENHVPMSPRVNIVEVDTEETTDAEVPDTKRQPSAAQINARMEEIHQKMRLKDRFSKEMSKEDLDIIFEDEHIIVVNKPSGILSVPGKTDNPSLNQVVYDAVGCEMGRMDMMVVHRLGMDTSGIMVFAKTMDALRGMNALFRTRSVDRKYEALVAGHVESNEGVIDLPLMRDYENPPYMRVSTEKHQYALMHFTSEDIHKKILEAPKESTTKYVVVSREEMGGEPVTRLTLTSASGRTHQLNVHCAAFGHPIVGDRTYGLGGDAAPNGGLTAEEMDELANNPARASGELQRRIAAVAPKQTMCIHAKSISFRHPISGDQVLFSVDAPF